MVCEICNKNLWKERRSTRHLAPRVQYLSWRLRRRPGVIEPRQTVVCSHRDPTWCSHWSHDREIIIQLAASSENQRERRGGVCVGLVWNRRAVRSLNGGLEGGHGDGRILRDATLRLRQQKGPRKADPWLHSCAEGRASPSRKEWLARHEVLVSVVGVHFRPPRGMQILTTCCRSNAPNLPPLPLYSFLSLFFFPPFFSPVHSKRHGLSRKSHNRNCARSSTTIVENLVEKWGQQGEVYSWSVGFPRAFCLQFRFTIRGALRLNFTWSFTWSWCHYLYASNIKN